MTLRSFRILVPVLALAAITTLAACGKERDRDGDADRATDESVERDSATLRAAAMNEWYTESKSARNAEGGVWSRDYRAYLLDVARAERARWPELMPGSKVKFAIGGSVWTNIGPTNAQSGPNGPGGTPVTDSGRITAIIPDGNRLFIATAGGGVWRRENGNWKPLTETVGTLACGSLAMDPSNHNRLYLGLGDAFDGTGVGVLVSQNGGDTWSDPVYLGDSMIIPQVLVDPATPSVVLAATDQGLFRSTNSGASFAPVAIPTGFTTPTFVWSLASTGGHTFALSAGTLAADSKITAAGQIWTSADDGASWTQATGLPAATSVGRITVASAPSNPLVVYAMAGAPNADTGTDLVDIYKSTNGGHSFTALGAANKTISGGGGKVNALLNQQGWYNQLVLVDPTDPNVAYFGGALLLAKTSDGGGTFKRVSWWLGGSAPYVHADFHAGAVDASGLYVGTDGGVFQSTDAGTSFSNSLNVGLVTHLLYSVGSSPAAPSAVIGGMQDNGTRLRSGTTSVFNEVIGGDGFGAAIHRTNGQKMLGTVYNDQIESSNNGGATWNDATSGIAEAGDGNNAPFITLIVPWEGPGSTGNEVYTTSNTKVYKSTNFGSSWTALPTEVTTDAVIRGVGIASGNASIVGVVGSGGHVYLTKDGGSTWATVASGKLTDPTSLPNSDRSLSSIHFDVSNTNVVYVTSVAPEASVNHIWKSTDFGAHWASIDGNGLPAGVPINFIKSDPVPAAGQAGQVLYVGTHMGVYRSTDAGASWSRFGAGLPLVNVTDMYIAPDESIVRVSTFGRGFWELSKPGNDFTISANPTTVMVAQGASGTSTITTAVAAGAAQNVALTVSGLPAGATAAFAPTSVTAGATSTLTLAAGPATPAGAYAITVTGTAAATTHAITVWMVVTSKADFSITAAPTALTVAPGASGTSTITTTITAGAAQSVALTVTGLPAGATAAFAPTSVTAGATSTLTISAGASTAPGTYPLTVTGTGTNATHTATISLTIGTPTSDFSITADPTALTVAQGASGSTTVTTAIVSGAAADIALTVTGLPTDASAAFAPTSVTAGATSTLTINAAATTPAGAYTISINGAGGGTSHAVTVALTVTAPGTNDFTLAVSPDSLLVDQGASGTATITTTISAGSAQAIDLAVSGLPAGATATITPTQVTAGATATIAITVASSTAVGTSTLTITGTATSGTHTASLTLDVAAPDGGGKPGGCGCSAGSSRDAGGHALLGLGVVALAFRRRRRRA